MLAVAYRNIIGASTGSTEPVSRVGCNDFATSGRQLQRHMQSTATNSLLRDLLEREAGYPARCWQLHANGYDKPKLLTSDRPSAIDVSLSHSESLAAAAITDLGAIGIDLEYRAPARSIYEIAAYAFGPQERQVTQSGGLRHFYRIWTLREALAKARGIGFPMLADRRDYFAQAPTVGMWQSIIDGQRWFFCADELPNDYAIAVALAPRASLPADCLADLAIRKFD
jgi:4'-phosphopantetheinyl transferase